MHQHILVTTVPTEPREVFRYLTEPELLPTWIGGLRESRPLGDGTMRVGAKSIEVVEERGKTVEMTSEVLAVDPDRALAVRITYPGVGDTDMAYELTPVAGGTELRLTVSSRFRGVARLVGWLARPAMRKQLRADLDRLARAVHTDDARER
jgi:uncharacterized protein YndB with AHSA1/START domain